MDDQVIKEFHALTQREPVYLELTPLEAWCVMAQLQLACKHPQNIGAARVVAEAVARSLQADLANSPELMAIAELGWVEGVTV